MSQALSVAAGSRWNLTVTKERVRDDRAGECWTRSWVTVTIDGEAIRSSAVGMFCPPPSCEQER